MEEAMTINELNTMIDALYADFQESDYKQTSSNSNKELGNLLCQNEPFNVEDDFNTRQFLKDGKKQSALDYFDNKSVNPNKYRYRYFVYSMLLDQFKEIKLKASDSVDWNKIIEMSKGIFSCTYDFLMENSEEETLILVKNRFKELGINFSFANGKVENGRAIFSTISSYIEKKIKENDGKSVLEALIKKLNEENYDNTFKRYIFTSDQHRFGDPLRLSIPWNYLIHLSLKHISNQGCFNENDFQLIIELSSKFLFLYNLQDFNIVDFIPLPGKINTEYLYRNLIHDNIFYFRQYNYKKFPVILKQLLKTDRDRRSLFWNEQGFSLSDYLDFVEKIYLKEGACSIVPGFIKKRTSAKETVILEKISNIDNANTEYSLPTDFVKITTIEKPFVKIGTDYFLTNKSIAAWSFYCFISSLNENQKYINIGDNIESIVKSKIPRDPRIKIYYGKYKNNAKEDAECDLVLEDKKYIIFIEIKKKTISGTSLNEANKKNLVFDLASIIMTSQTQALRHEINLRDDGQIEFSNESILSFSGQHVYKISVSLFDLYSFNNHAFVISLVNYLRNIKFSFENEDHMTREERRTANDNANIDGINKKIKQLNEYIKKLDEKHHVSVRENRFYSYFFSLEQLLFLFEECSKTGKLLGEILDSMKHISLGQKDFFSEYKQLARFQLTSQ